MDSMADMMANLTRHKFIFATSRKAVPKSEPSYFTESAEDRSLVRKSLMRHWGRENRLCQFKKQTFHQARALYLLRKREELPVRMRNFGRFVLHVNDFYVLQQQLLIQRVSHRIQKRRNFHVYLHSFFKQWCSV